MSARRHPSQTIRPGGAVRMDTDCVACVHLRADATCAAFPQGIPGPVYHGFQPHDEVRPDQVTNTVFKPRADAEVEWLDAQGVAVG